MRPERSHFRLTFSQTFNSLGTFIGPYLGAVLFLKGVEVKEGTAITDAVREQSLLGIDRAFFWIAGLIILIAVVIWIGNILVLLIGIPLLTARVRLLDALAWWLEGTARVFHWLAGIF